MQNNNIDLRNEFYSFRLFLPNFDDRPPVIFHDYVELDIEGHGSIYTIIVRTGGDMVVIDVERI